MFDVGFAELVLVFVLGLLVLGPERLPSVAAQIGRWVGRARRTASQLRRQLERELELNELTQRRPLPPRPKPAPASTPTVNGRRVPPDQGSPEPAVGPTPPGSAEAAAPESSDKPPPSQ